MVAELENIGKGAALVEVLAACSGRAVITEIGAVVLAAAPSYKHSGLSSGHAETGAGVSKIPSPPPSCLL